MTVSAKKDSAGKLALLGIQHVFAMFGATVLVPMLTGMSPAVALFCAGVGTWIFHLCTGRKVPTFLGSSFAFIAAIQGAAQICSDNAEIGTDAYLAALPYATGGIIVAGALYLVLALLVRLVGAERVRSFFPPIVTGPVVTIIGLMLAPSAINNITTQIGTVNVGLNWLVAAVAVAAIFVTSLFAKGLFKLVPILIGIIVGYVAAICCGMVDFTTIAQAPWLDLPPFFLPKFDMRAIGLVAPIAIVTFVEHIGDVTASSAVVGKDFIKDPGLHRSLFADNFSTMISGFIGSVPTTTYGENIGVMAITKVYSVRVIGGAAVLSIICSFVGPLAALIQTIPGPVIGGISFLLYGMIGTSGLRILVDNHVDYSKNRNMILTSVIFVTGLSGVTLALGDVSLSGMTLAAIVGMIMSLVFYAFDKFHLSNDA